MAPVKQPVVWIDGPGGQSGRMEMTAMRIGASRSMGRRGFSLIELLVVIAIIAILAAILFPVFGRAREATQKTACMSQLHSIGEAVKLYHEDMQKYPPILLCNPYINTTTLYTGSGTPLPAGKVRNRPLALGKYANDTSLFHCPDNPNNDPSKVFTGAVYPPGTLSGTSGAYFYSYDSYDTGLQLTATGLPASPAVQEVHYALDWTGTIGPNDPPNQLKYPTPPDDKTVITWCTYHVAIARGDQIPVLLLNGTAKSVPYSQFVYKSASVPNGPLHSF